MIIWIGPCITFMCAISGVILLVKTIRVELTSSNYKRLQRLYYSPPDEKRNKIKKSLLTIYRHWIIVLLKRIGLEDREKKYYSLLNSIFLYATLTSYGFLVLSGFPSNESISNAFVIGTLSLTIPNIGLWYAAKRRSDKLSSELLIIMSYIFDAVESAHKDLYTALDESLNFSTLLTAPLERFLNRYRSSSLEIASNEFMKEVPIKDAEQFMFLISNGLSYQDRENLIEYLNTTAQTRHSLWMSARDRRGKQRETVFTIMAIIPSLLAVTVVLFCMYERVVTVLSATQW